MKGIATRRLCAALIALAGAVAALALATAPSAFALPDDRAYEMVSPPDKNDGDLGLGAFGPGQYTASADGNSFIYMALGGFGDAPTNSIVGAYVAHRGADWWQSYSAMLPQNPYSSLGGAIVGAVSRDFTRVATLTNRDQETGEYTAGPGGDMYLLDPVTKEAERIPHDPIDGVYQANNPLDNITGNADLSEVVFHTRQNLTPDAPTGNSPKVYKYADGEVTLESRLPDESAVNAQLPSPSSTHQATNPVSADARVIYFVASSRLYRRDLTGPTPETTFVAAEENPDEDVPPGNATFAGASADGTIAYFVSNQRLVAEDTDSQNDIYQYDHSQPIGSRLTLVSVDSEPADTASVTGNTHGVSADGRTIYFNSNSQLVAGETTEAGTKLFGWRDGELRFIAVTGSAVSAANSVPSEDGERFGFLSNGANITPDDNGGLAQAYVYEWASDEVACASCVPGGTNTQAAAWRRPSGLGWWRSESAPRRNISSDGHVFFETREPLVSRDTNGQVDVYLWQEGEVDLISTGRSGDGSHFADASADGSTIFFTTRERISGWDFDDHVDAYAARVGGGLPEPPPPPPPPCSGDDCQGPPGLPPLFPPLGSIDVEGAGNPAPKAADCTRAERKAERLGKKAKRLQRRAKRAEGKRRAELRRKAKQAKRKAKQAKRAAERCNRERNS